MTLARKVKQPDGSFLTWVGGVWCSACERDRYIRSDTGECLSCGAVNGYKPRGLVVKECK